MSSHCKLLPRIRCGHSRRLSAWPVPRQLLQSSSGVRALLGASGSESRIPLSSSYPETKQVSAQFGDSFNWYAQKPYFEAGQHLNCNCNLRRETTYELLGAGMAGGIPDGSGRPAKLSRVRMAWPGGCMGPRWLPGWAESRARRLCHESRPAKLKNIVAPPARLTGKVNMRPVSQQPTIRPEPPTLVEQERVAVTCIE